MIENCITSLKKRKGTFFLSYMQINYAIFTIFLLYCICRIRDYNLYHAIIDLK